MDYEEPCCCFDVSCYTGRPDSTPCKNSLDVPAIIRKLDGLNNSGRETDAESYLEGWLDKARSAGDWRSELSIINELLGQYRRTKQRDKGMAAVNTALDIIRAHKMGNTVSAATVMLNAATTMKCFGEAKSSLPIFEHVCRVYANSLDPNDYRFGGLYNNMALSYADVGDIERAEEYFIAAMRVISKCEHPQNELAVTLCNMVEMYRKTNLEDGRIEKCLDRAWEYLNAPDLPHDGSQCFGYDDEISKDHDFETGFCLWIDDETDVKIGVALAREYRRLPIERASVHSALAESALGVRRISDFYRRYTGSDGAPRA